MEKFYDSEGYETTWEDAVEIVRENPYVTQGEEHTSILFTDEKGLSYSILDIADDAGIEIEIVKEDSAWE